MKMVRIWPDAFGKISKVRIVRGTGNKEMDKMIEDEVLLGLYLNEQTPKDLPLPIMLRITAKKR